MQGINFLKLFVFYKTSPGPFIQIFNRITEGVVASKEIYLTSTAKQIHKSIYSPSEVKDILPFTSHLAFCHESAFKLCNTRPGGCAVKCHCSHQNLQTARRRTGCPKRLQL